MVLWYRCRCLGLGRLYKKYLGCHYYGNDNICIAQEVAIMLHNETYMLVHRAHFCVFLIMRRELGKTG